MPRPFKWAEYFNKDAALQNRSNKYQVSCVRCQKKIPKGRSEERTRHLVEECTGLAPEEREQIIRAEEKEAEAAAAAAAGGLKPKGRPPTGAGAGAAKGGFGDTETEELLKLMRLHSLENNDQQGWQALFDQYNNWAEANGFKRRSVDVLKKQWDSRANSRLHPPGGNSNFSWDDAGSESRVIPWTLPGLGGFDEDDPSGGDTDHDALGDPNATDLGAGPSSGYSLAPPLPRFDPELSSTTTPPPPPTNLSPPQSTNSCQQRPSTQYRQAEYPRPPPTNRRLPMNSQEPTSNPDPVPPAPSSLIDFLGYENMQKAKRIERLETRADKLEEKVDRLDAKNRKLEDQNRKLESQNQMLKMQLMVASSSVSAKRKRGNSDFLVPDLQDDVVSG